MILVKFTRRPVPPVAINPHNEIEYQPWYEAIQVPCSPQAIRRWKNLAIHIDACIRNHHRDYQYWNYKICKMEICWMLGKTQMAPQVLYEFNYTDNYLEVHEGQHERIATALTMQERSHGDYMRVTYEASPSSNGLPENLSFMEE